MIIKTIKVLVVIGVIFIIGTLGLFWVEKGNNYVYLREVLYTPGELTVSHKGVDCIKCHIPYRKINDKECKECHDSKNFKRISKDHSLHSHLATLKLKEMTIDKRSICLICHTEHQGGRIKAKYTFREMGHDGFLVIATKCEDCHVSDNRHRNMTKNNCKECHKVNNWLTPFTHEDIKGISNSIETGKWTLNKDLINTCGECHRKGWHLSGMAYGQLGNSKGFECKICH